MIKGIVPKSPLRNGLTTKFVRTGYSLLSLEKEIVLWRKSQGDSCNDVVVEKMTPLRDAAVSGGCVGFNDCLHPWSYNF